MKVEDKISKYIKKYEGSKNKEKEDLYKILGAMMMLIIRCEERQGIYQEDSVEGILEKALKDFN